MKEAIEGNWNRDDLSYRVRDIGELRKAPTLRWRRPEGVLWNYKIKDISKEKGTLLVDLGFYCYYELPSRVLMNSKWRHSTNRKTKWNLEFVRIKIGFKTLLLLW
ncbi:hypothetical protein LEP1GSC089_0043 [Leptospira interrogans serovar Autumnalis str. LP101]|nr:hypothetical protein LEP1GSC089_0043 [Leptospira interrogans serovar Autumnalis str. LP101]